MSLLRIWQNIRDLGLFMVFLGVIMATSGLKRDLQSNYFISVPKPKNQYCTLRPARLNRLAPQIICSLTQKPLSRQKASIFINSHIIGRANDGCHFNANYSIVLLLKIHMLISNSNCLVCLYNKLQH